MKIKLIADLKIDEIFDIDDDLTEGEISDYSWNYIEEKIDWDWYQVDEDEVEE